MHLADSGVLLVFLVVVALAFDFLNGLHDAANSIATIVSTRVLPAQYAVLWAACFNFVAFLVFGLNVAQTVGKGILQPAIVSDAVIFGAVGGAIAWNVITWMAGIPSSSSHALNGGLLGAGVAKAGLDPIVWAGVLKTVGGIVLSPLLGFVLALALVLLVAWLFHRSTPVLADLAFRRLQFVSASLMSLGHGGNDAQKTMGIITVLLYAHGKLSGAFHVPLWVVLACQAAMGLGTLAGGWRVIGTLGEKVTKLDRSMGTAAEVGAGAAIMVSTWL
ncbi:MAG TPA: inorganic phosphate transporter, partial [Myxococcales bacterium]